MFTEKEKQEISNYLCRGGLTVVGMAIGSLTIQPAGIIGAGAAAFLYSKKTCKYLVPALKKKIWDSEDQLTKSELNKVLTSMKMVDPTLSNSEILNVINVTRGYSKKQKELFKKHALI